MGFPLLEQTPEYTVKDITPEQKLQLVDIYASGVGVEDCRIQLNIPRISARIGYEQIEAGYQALIALMNSDTPPASLEEAQNTLWEMVAGQPYYDEAAVKYGVQKAVERSTFAGTWEDFVAQFSKENI